MSNATDCQIIQKAAPLQKARKIRMHALKWKGTAVENQVEKQTESKN